MSNTVTKENRVLEALRANDRGLTAAQIESQFGVGNARSTVSALRMKGMLTKRLIQRVVLRLSIV
jgi:hypothetical protein